METIGDIGELALIERLKPFCAADAVGDDAALMSLRSGHRLVVTTDVLVEGVHFSDRTTPPYTVGWRSAAANLSDLAAMGAEAIGITVGLGLPQSTPWPWVEALYQGMTDCLSAHGAKIYGGDLCRAEQQTVAITALGEVEPQRAIRRDSAEPDMAVVVTGAHGGSRAGLAVLLEEAVLSEAAVRTSLAEAWVRSHQMPVPRFDAIAHLKSAIDKSIQNNSADSIWPTIAGMDSSDGLANALLQLSHRSQVGIEVFRADIPLPDGLAETVGYETALNWALYGGEDFELVLCLPHALANALVEKGATVIGRTVKRTVGITVERTTETTVETTPKTTGEVYLLENEQRSEGKRITHNSFQHF